MTEVVITVAAVVAAIGTLYKFGPLRWIFGQLVSKPVTEWADGVVNARVEPIRVENAADHAVVQERLGELGSEVSGLATNVEDLTTNVEGLTKRLDNTAVVLDEELGLEV